MNTWLVKFIDDNGITNEIEVIFRTFNPRNNTWQLRSNNEEEFIIKKNKIISMYPIWGEK